MGPYWLVPPGYLKGWRESTDSVFLERLDLFVRFQCLPPQILDL